MFKTDIQLLYSLTDSLFTLFLFSGFNIKNKFVTCFCILLHYITLHYITLHYIFGGFFATGVQVELVNLLDLQMLQCKDSEDDDEDAAVPPQDNKDKEEKQQLENNTAEKHQHDSSSDEDSCSEEELRGENTTSTSPAQCPAAPTIIIVTPRIIPQSLSQLNLPHFYSNQPPILLFSLVQYLSKHNFLQPLVQN